MDWERLRDGYWQDASAGRGKPRPYKELDASRAVVDRGFAKG
jgi:hypothetical protein